MTNAEFLRVNLLNFIFKLSCKSVGTEILLTKIRMILASAVFLQYIRTSRRCFLSCIIKCRQTRRECRQGGEVNGVKESGAWVVSESIRSQRQRVCECRLYSTVTSASRSPVYESTCPIIQAVCHRKLGKRNADTSVPVIFHHFISRIDASIVAIVYRNMLPLK